MYTQLLNDIKLAGSPTITMHRTLHLQCFQRLKISQIIVTKLYHHSVRHEALRPLLSRCCCYGRRNAYVSHYYDVPPNTRLRPF